MNLDDPRKTVLITNPDENPVWKGEEADGTNSWRGMPMVLDFVSNPAHDSYSEDNYK